MEFKPIDVDGTIQRLEVHGIDALCECMVIEIHLEKRNTPEGASAGTFKLSLTALGQFFRDAGDAVAESESRKPQSQ